MKTTRRAPGLAVTLVLLASAPAPGCLGQAGTETGNPPVFGVQLSLAAPDVTVTNALTADPATGVRVDEVWVAVERVKFVPGGAGCDQPAETESDLRGPVIADLAAAPELFDLAVAAGEYCRVRVRFDRAGRGSGPAELEDHAVLVRGQRGDGTPFAIRSRLTPDIDVRSRAASFTLAEGRDAVLLAFDAKAWVAAVDLDRAVAEDGAILVDDGSNRELLAGFEEALERHLSLHEDRDRDGTLAADEAEPLAAP